MFPGTCFAVFLNAALTHFNVALKTRSSIQCHKLRYNNLNPTKTYEERADTCMHTNE
jgi:biotin synthase-like enzyme